MPSTTQSVVQEKTPKRERACDACRRRKTKCDGPSKPKHICTNCSQTRKACTYVEASKPRGPSKAYVTGLEDEQEGLEKLIQTLTPGVDYSEELGPAVVRGSWKGEDEPAASSRSRTLKSSLATNVLSPLMIPYESPTTPQATDRGSPINSSSRSTHLVFGTIPRPKRLNDNSHVGSSFRTYRSGDDSYDESSSSSSEAEEVVSTSLVGREKINLYATENGDATEDHGLRFTGRSSTAGLVETTRLFKHMHMIDVMHPTPEAPLPAIPDNLTVAQWRRREFWTRPDWEYSYDGADSLDVIRTFLDYFPPLDLANHLIELYFRHSNLIFPLLHRPTFERQWKDALHTRSIWFSVVCVSMFAVASRWCEDERLLPEDSIFADGKLNWTSAGRQYFEIAMDIHRVRRSLFHPPSLFEVQALTLMGMYLNGTEEFSAAWTLVSVGLRKAQDVGAHRKKVYRTEPNADDELWKRAIWHLIVLDRLGGANLGRARGIAEEDFDIDFPLEVDDEYWEPSIDHQEPLKQPPGVPSSMTAFVQLIKLTQIMAFAMRTLYPINKSQIYHGFVKINRQTITKQLSLAMSEWLDRVPKHLKWNEKMDISISIFLCQSAFLYTSYYLTQMLIYRPLITRTAKSSLPNPALTICTNAAKACAQILNSQQRWGLHHFYVPHTIDVSYVCCSLFLLTAWNLKVQEKELRKRGIPDVKPPLAQRIDENIANAKIFVRALETIKQRWDVVGMLLNELNQVLAGVEEPFAKGVSLPSHPDVSNLDSIHSSASFVDRGHTSHSDYARRPQRNQPSLTSLRTVQQPTETLTLKYTRLAPGLRSFASSESLLQIRLSSQESALEVRHETSFMTDNTWNALRPPSSTLQAQVSNTPTTSQRGRPRSPSLTTVLPSWTERLGAPPFISSLRRTSSMNSHMDLTSSSRRPGAESEHEINVKYEDINMHVDDRIYLSSSNVQPGYSSSSSSTPLMQNSSSRGFHDMRRMDTSAWGIRHDKP